MCCGLGRGLWVAGRQVGSVVGQRKAVNYVPSGERQDPQMATSWLVTMCHLGDLCPLCPQSTDSLSPLWMKM